MAPSRSKRTKNRASISVLIVDDHRSICEALQIAMNCEPDIRVVGQAADGYEAVRLADELAPDVVIMDIVMPLLNGVDACRRIVAAHPKIKVVAYSAYSDPGSLRQMFVAGATGYLCKDCSLSEIAAAVRAARRGTTYLGKGLVGPVVHALAEPANAEGSSAFDLLTQREREVVQLLVEGHWPKEIADDLGMTPSTVSVHRKHAMDKLGVGNLAQLTKLAIRHRLTSVEW